jgi:hypothetical protein
VNEDLKAIYPQNPAAINLESEMLTKPKGVKIKMTNPVTQTTHQQPQVAYENQQDFIGKAFHTYRVINSLMMWGCAVFGLLCLFYLGAQAFAPNLLGTDPVHELDKDLQAKERLRGIIKYCGRGSMDVSTCQVWINSYDELLTGEFQPVELAAKENADQINDMKRRHGIKVDSEAEYKMPGKKGGEGL